MEQRKPIKVLANAKINLALRITGKRPDGYHTISTIFQEIGLHDNITFSPSDEFCFSCSRQDLESENNNLCIQTYKNMKSLAPEKPEWNIHLQKNIPIGAGLGGGSSDSAAVIKFLNKIWGLQLTESELIQIAKEIGSDVPFHLRGKTQGADGVGDILTPLTIPESFTLLLICPPIHISTLWAYKQFNLKKRKQRYKFASLFSRGRIIWEFFENQFETIVFPAYPEVGILKESLLKEGAKYAGLSGSGSTVFGVFKNTDEAKSAQKRFTSYHTSINHPILF